MKGKSLSRVRLFETPWTAAYQAPPSMEFSRQEYGFPIFNIINKILIEMVFFLFFFFLSTCETVLLENIS